MKTKLLQFLLITLFLITSISPLQGAVSAANLATHLSGSPATPGAITGPARVCPGQTVAYSVEAVAGALSYTWSVPSSWVITAGQGTRQIMVVIGAASGAVRVSAQNNNGESGNSSLQATIVSVPPQPEAIEGPAVLCAGERAVYRVQDASEEVVYNWVLPAGWMIEAGQKTGVIEVLATAGGGAILVNAANECGSSIPVRLDVTGNPVIAKNQIQEGQVICVGNVPKTLVASVPTGGDDIYTYLWESSTTSADEGFVAAAGVNNNNNYTPNHLNKTTWFRRTVISGGCLHISEAVEVTVVQLPDKPAIERTGDMELRASLDGAHYEWRRNGVLLDSRTQTVAIEGEGTYDVRVVNSTGCFSPYSDAMEVVVTGLADEALASGVSMSLHPGRSQIQITTEKPLSHVELRIVDLLGHELHRKKIPHLAGTAKLELGHLPDGVYLLLLQAPNLYLKQKVLLQR